MFDGLTERMCDCIHRILAWLVLVTVVHFDCCEGELIIPLFVVISIVYVCWHMRKFEIVESYVFMQLLRMKILNLLCAA